MRRNFLKIYKIKANAKINIGLNILGKAENGYHLLDMTMLPISYYDTLRIQVFSQKGGLHIFCKDRSIPRDKRNILFKIYEKFYQWTQIEPEKIKISLRKNIPSEAGLGGGSSDGAFFLKFLNTYYSYPLSKEELFRLAFEVGSDLPFFLKNMASRVEGTGEKITPFFHQSKQKILIFKPKFGFSTKEAYELSDAYSTIKMADIPLIIQGLKEGNIQEKEENISNHLEEVLLLHKKELKKLKEKIEKYTRKKAFMTGSGSAYYIFLEEKSAYSIRRKCKKYFKDCKVQLCNFL